MHIFALSNFLRDERKTGRKECFILKRLIGLLLALALLPLCAFNGNAWAFMALPLLYWFGAMPGDVPRHRHTFLGYYGAHLAILAMVAVVIGI